MHKLAQSDIPAAISAAATAMLAPYSNGLTPEKLAKAIAFQPEEKAEKLLTRREASEALHVSLPTVDRMLNSGQLNRVRVRGRAFIRVSDVSRIISGEVAV